MADIDVAQRPRTRTMTSHDSKWSHPSRKSDHGDRLDLMESPKEKMKIHGKTDPSKALTELQPAAEALQESTMGNLRKESFTGRDGQVIKEPDASNPTRYRWERPLQTIMGFEDDVHRTYREKVMNGRSYDRPQSGSDMYSRAESRRSSYFGGYHQNNQSQYNAGYYRNGYDGQEENAATPTGPYGQPYANTSSFAMPHNNQGPRGSRGYSEPYGRPIGGGGGGGGAFNGGPVGGSHGEYQTPYAQPPYQNSRELVNPSPESDAVAGISTGPSSYGSSYNGPPTPGYDRMGSPPMASGPGMGKGGGPKPLPQAPRIAEDENPPAPNIPMKLNTGVDTGDGGFEKYQSQRRRTSWLKRRFSKEY